MPRIKYLGRNRRKLPRLNLRLAVIYQIHQPFSVRTRILDKEIVATVLDLNENGMAISTDYDLPLQTDLSIKLTLFKVHNNGEASCGEPIDIIGEVCSSSLIDMNLYRLGVSFIRIDEQDKKKIVDFLAVNRAKLPRLT